MLFWQYAVLVVLAFGHVALWIAFFNRTHSFKIPGRYMRFVELAQILAAVGLLGLIIERYVTHTHASSALWDFGADTYWLAPYGGASVLFGGWTAVNWVRRNIRAQSPPQLLAIDSRLFHLRQELGEQPARGWSTRLFACLPMNQMFDLSVDVKSLLLPRLPRELDGLTITHLSDLHFTGKITRPFFDRVIDHAEALGGDLVVVTGDILESEACYEWLQPTLGRLTAPYGKFFVLGNHDRRVRDVGRLRRALTDLGFIDAAQGLHEVSIRGQTVRLSGNELPWFGPPVEPPLPDDRTKLRILLAHTPDQFGWAIRRDFDLLLAGHTHGGHIRLPFIGPICCPSRYGVEYAGGIFFQPPTLMHVSRGISGLDPLRFNCPPEVAKLVLRSPEGLESAGEHFGAEEKKSTCPC